MSEKTWQEIKELEFPLDIDRKYRDELPGMVNSIVESCASGTSLITGSILLFAFVSLSLTPTRWARSRRGGHRERFVFPDREMTIRKRAQPFGQFPSTTGGLTVFICRHSARGGSSTPGKWRNTFLSGLCVSSESNERAVNVQ